MKLLTFLTPDTSEHLGVLVGDDQLLDLTSAAHGDGRMGSMLDLIDAGPQALGEVRVLVEQARAGAMSRHLRPVDGARLCAPVPRPRKNVYCVGLNFRSHVEQNAAALDEVPDIPAEPLFFSKPVTAVVGPGEAVRHDRRLTSKLDYEVELAIVIGSRGTWIPRHRAWEHIFGFTVLNDVSARDLQWRNSQFLYGKGQDSYCPLGPVITTKDEMPPLKDVNLRLLVNGEVRQEESADHMLFTPDAVVAELSRGITLEPGDIISLGTPGGCGYQMVPPQFLTPGDLVECDVTGIGRLANPVVDVAPPDEPTTKRHEAAEELEEQK